MAPLLPLAQALVEAGHDVRWLTGHRFADVVGETGATWLPLPDAVDFDDRHLNEQFPSRAELREGRGGASGSLGRSRVGHPASSANAC